MFKSLLVANRGEIARRIFATARAMGIRTVAVYSDADADLPHVVEADDAVLLGPADPRSSYRDPLRLIGAAERTGADAIHPGYGFLSENAAFADAVLDAGLAWIGPPPEAIEAMGDKIAARNVMARAGVPVAPGTRTPVLDVGVARAAAERIGYPLMVKAAAGGGGIGMAVVHDDTQLLAAFGSARDRAARVFGSPAMLLERYVENARHVEVQILGMTDGRIVTLGERDCSVQRRHQKVIEESPSPGVDARLRERMAGGAIRAAEAVGYRNAGTVECLVDPATQEYVFLEMNTRLQVEHPVTEMVTGIDLVEEQLRIAAGENSPASRGQIESRGHALELRVYAEDPERFLPSPGLITAWREPSGAGIRVDAGYGLGNIVTPHYDPLLAKLCVWGPDRATALARARVAVDSFLVAGPKTNLPFLRRVLVSPEFVSGRYDTSIVERLPG